MIFVKIISARFLKWSTPDRKLIGFNQIFYFLFGSFICKLSYIECNILFLLKSPLNS